MTVSLVLAEKAGDVIVDASDLAVNVGEVGSWALNYRCGYIHFR